MVMSIVMTLSVAQASIALTTTQQTQPQQQRSEHSPGNSVVKGFGLAGLSRRAAAETLRWLKTME